MVGETHRHPVDNSKPLSFCQTCANCGHSQEKGEWCPDCLKEAVDQAYNDPIDGFEAFMQMQDKDV